jgi:signal transduction histidine kinase
LDEIKTQEDEIKIKTAMNDISLQIVHDLRSPIAALNTLEQYANFDLVSHKNILVSCIQRMECLVGELLYDQGKRLSNPLKYNNSKIINVSELIANIVNEKTILLHHEQKSIQINVNGEKCVSAFVNESRLLNIISNILNNSIEAIDESGKIDINLSYSQDVAFIEIVDDGKGIPQLVLDSLGEKKISVNKKNGNGIGLFSAFNYLHMIGGAITLCNNEFFGATALIKIPRNYEFMDIKNVITDSIDRDTKPQNNTKEV